MTVRKESTSVGVFRPEDAREIKKRVLGNDRAANSLQGHSGKFDLGWHFCLLLENLGVATNPLTGYTQADARIIFYPENTNSLNNVVSTADPITITNRSPSNSAGIGDLLLVRFIVREWAPMWCGGGQHLQVIMREDLLAAVNTKTDPSTAQARILRRKEDGDLRLSLDEVTVVNRFKNISIDKGVYAKVEWIGGEWQPYAADCPPGESIDPGSV